MSGIICDGDTEDPLPDPEGIPDTSTDSKSSFIFTTMNTSKYLKKMNIKNKHEIFGCG